MHGAAATGLPTPVSSRGRGLNKAETAQIAFDMEGRGASRLRLFLGQDSGSRPRSGREWAADAELGAIPDSAWDNVHTDATSAPLSHVFQTIIRPAIARRPHRPQHFELRL